MAAAAAVALTLQAAPPSRAQEVAIPGGALPLAAADVTAHDTDLADAAREVVVAVDTAGGLRIHKLRAATQAQAEALVRSLDARAGVTAQPNATISVAPTATGSGAKTGAAVDLTSPVRASLASLANEALGSQEWGMFAVGAETAWAITRASSITVAVVDTGVDATHQDLAARVLPQIDLVGDGSTGDPNGHGTHVAGIVGASLDGSGVVGLANAARILPVRVMSADGTGDVATVSAGIVAAVDAGARVVNLSLGTEVPSQVLADAVAYATGKGVTVVAAGGNDYEAGNDINYPAALPGVLAVSSLAADGSSSYFANTGSYIDITAPGEEILSTWPAGTWASASGTSMAAPFVSGAAALVRAANPHFGKSTVDATLTGTALDDDSGDGRDDVFGTGLLQADLAARRAATAPYGLRAPAVTAHVRAVGTYSKLYVNVNPNMGSGYWTFRVQKRRADGTWATLTTLHRTYGTAETRTLDLPKGTYRVHVHAKYGYRAATSASVTLKR